MKNKSLELSAKIVTEIEALGCEIQSISVENSPRPAYGETVITIKATHQDGFGDSPLNSHAKEIK